MRKRMTIAEKVLLLVSRKKDVFGEDICKTRVRNGWGREYIPFSGRRVAQKLVQCGMLRVRYEKKSDKGHALAIYSLA